MNEIMAEFEKNKQLKYELYNDSFQNFRRYGIPKAQLVVADVPFNVGTAFYGSRVDWYIGGDNKNGESEKAGKAAFYSDFNFNLFEFWNFASHMVKKEPKKAVERGKSSDAPCLLVFCSFEQIPTMIQAAKKYGFEKNIPLVFCKNYSPQVLKANMRVVGATEYALILYKDKLPKFRNKGQMVFNWFPYERDSKNIPKIHPTQKSVAVLKRLIEIFTDPGDVVIDPCFGSGSTARACMETGRNFYGFEINKEFYRRAKEEMCNPNYINEKDQIEGQMSIMDFIGSAS